MKNELYSISHSRILLCLCILFCRETLSAWADPAQAARDADRGTDYFIAAAAARAATDKVADQLVRDATNGGEGAVLGALAQYQTNYPNASDDSYWTNFSFAQQSGGPAGTWAGRSQSGGQTVITGIHHGMNAVQDTFRLFSDTTYKHGGSNTMAGCVQEVQIASIPMCEFAIFYNVNLEMMPGANMNVAGRVHSNTNIYLYPGQGKTLTFSNDVTASGGIIQGYMTNVDTFHAVVTNGTVVFAAGVQALSQVPVLIPPIGTGNFLANAHALLDIPPVTEDQTSAMGTNRFYNLADVVIVVSNSSVTARSGYFLDAGNTAITDWTNFITITNAGQPVALYNGREQITNLLTQLDVAKFKAWAENATNVLKSKFPPGQAAAATVYIADCRQTNRIFLTTNVVHHVITTNFVPVEIGVRLINGTNLPVSGLTVASPNPVYIFGDYNTTTNNVNFSSAVNSTVNTRPAAVFGDAITVLSKGWYDTYGTNILGNATDTTINAALSGGIVPTDTNSYSGGLENLPRLIENWSGHNFWFNGSLICLFNSQIATAPWLGTGGYYNAPTRKWAFDTNFTDMTKLPPNMPMVKIVQRSRMSIVPVSFDPTK